MEFDRERRHLFNQVAQEYQRYRPGYPVAAWEDLMARTGLQASARVLELGCGTGQATRQLLDRGLRVDALELGAETAALAREILGHQPGLRIHHTAFEDFDGLRHSYDLVLSAQAFHWMDPKLRLSRCRDFLVPRGHLALLNNYTPSQGETLDALAGRIETLSEGRMRVADASQPEKQTETWKAELEAASLFESPHILRHPWDCTYDAESFVGLFGTYSDFMALPPPVQQAIRAEIHSTFAAAGGRLVRRYLCVLVLARRRD